MSDRGGGEYGLVWDTTDTEDHNSNPPELEFIESKSVGTGETGNMLIEGDNLHALQILNRSYGQKIDMIYIDPPYNTGNEFAYNDRMAGKNDRHSKWLSFMQKRLELSKTLLSPRGVVFISIDDHEQANLKLLCDSIFGEDNFYAMMSWKSRTKPTNSGSAKYNIQKTDEYILVYGKVPMRARKFNLEANEETRPHMKYETDANGNDFRLKPLQQRKNIGIRNRPTMVFPIQDITPRQGYRWTMGREGVRNLAAHGKILVKNYTVYEKIFRHEDSPPLRPFYASLFDTAGSSESGKRELDKIVPDHGFETVKPVELIQKLVFHSTSKNSIILDFFAGSGTTGHAVLKMNMVDGGHRRFILCTNNDSSICTKVCHPRLSRVIQGYENNDGKSVKGLGSTLKYFKIKIEI